MTTTDLLLIIGDAACFCAALGIAAAEITARCHRVGGLTFFRFGRFGGSVYLSRG